MGGNAKALFRNTGTVRIHDERLAFAQPIDFGSVPPKQLLIDVQRLLEINSLRARAHVWSSSTIFSGKNLLGSSSLLTSVDESDLITIKKTLGDIDVAVPAGRISYLNDVLTAYEGRKVNDQFTYMGCSKLKFDGKKINSVFFYERCFPGIFVQIDFDATEFSGDEPDPYFRFMRSSSWRDCQSNIKGVAHKFLLVSLARAVFDRDASILTPKSPLHPSRDVRLRTEQAVHFVSFGENGFREKYVQQFRMGYPVMVHGKYSYKEVPRNESKSTKDTSDIFKKLFSKDPSKVDESDFESYLGLLDIMQRCSKQTHVEKTYRMMLHDKLWGRGQQLYRGDPKRDRNDKEVIIRELECRFPYLVGQEPLEKIIETYYENYEEKTEWE